MLACVNDQGEALEEIYRRHNRQVHAYVARHLRRSDQVQDLVQEIFLRVFQQRKQYKPTGRFTVWLYRIARNLCIDESRRYWNRLVSRETELAGDSEGATFLESLPFPQRAICDAIDDSRKAQLVERALQELPPAQREIIILTKFQGLSYREISEVTGHSPEAVKQHVYRALIRLRGILAPRREDLIGSSDSIQQERQPAQSCRTVTDAVLEPADVLPSGLTQAGYGATDWRNS
jgi:RNA polymerase sigma-70 factor (ECF subfamily)